MMTSQQSIKINELVQTKIGFQIATLPLTKGIRPYGLNETQMQPSTRLLLVLLLTTPKAQLECFDCVGVGKGVCM